MKVLDYLLIMTYELVETRIESKRALKLILKTIFIG